jgi:hypothetical protein
VFPVNYELGFYIPEDDILQDRNCQTVHKYLVMSPRRGSTPRHTDRPTVSSKVTQTLHSRRRQNLKSYMSNNIFWHITPWSSFELTGVSEEDLVSILKAEE